jgi:hypothetical protein
MTRETRSRPPIAAPIPALAPVLRLDVDDEDGTADVLFGGGGRPEVSLGLRVLGSEVNSLCISGSGILHMEGKRREAEI